MIGQRIACSVWRVEYKYRNLERPDSWVQNVAIICTADPTGADAIDVARLVVLGATAKPEHQFTVVTIHYANEIQGLANVVSDGPRGAEGVLLQHALGGMAREHALQVCQLTDQLAAASNRLRDLNALIDGHLIYSTKQGHRWVMEGSVRAALAPGGAEAYLSGSARCVRCGDVWSLVGDLAPMPECPRQAPETAVIAVSGTTAP